jgi:archaeosine synthase
MTRHFEVRKRDGPARIGRFLLDKKVETPFIIRTAEESPIINMGSVWRYNRDGKRDFMKENRDGKLIILPYDPSLDRCAESASERSFGTRPNLESGFPVGDFASGIAIDPENIPDRRHDLYVIARFMELTGKPMDLVRTVTKTREDVPPDVAIYAPSAATPENVALLIYLGIDVVDDVLATIKGYQDLYLTREGEFTLYELTELPCVCPICSSMNIDELMGLQKKERAELLANHNIEKLMEEVKVVKELIRRGLIREYVEKQCRSSPLLVASLRILDDEQNYLERRTPIARKNKLFSNTMESLHRIEIRRFAERVRNRFRYDHDGSVLVLLPCSARKPYSISSSHRLFISALGSARGKVHEAIVTSPLGVVPRELELMYPAAHYDIPVTGFWDAEERKWVCECLSFFLRANGHEYTIAHLDGAYKEICKNAVEGLDIDIDIEFTSGGKATSDESLRALGDAVKNISGRNRSSSFSRKRDMLRAIANYQFGMGADSRLIPDGVRISGKLPGYRVHLEGEKLAMVSNYGLLELTIGGAERLRDFGSYWVKINDFIPKGSILAPGVLDADPQIRTNDEVIIFGEKVFGVGRAIMNGWEMVESSRGVAVDIRDVEESLDRFTFGESERPPLDRCAERKSKGKCFTP